MTPSHPSRVHSEHSSSENAGQPHRWEGTLANEGKNEGGERPARPLTFALVPKPAAASARYYLWIDRGGENCKHGNIRYDSNAVPENLRLKTKRAGEAVLPALSGFIPPAIGTSEPSAKISVASDVFNGFSCQSPQVYKLKQQRFTHKESPPFSRRGRELLTRGSVAHQ